MAQGEAPQETAPAPGDGGRTPDQEQQEGTPRDQKPDLPDLNDLLDRYDPEALRKNRKFMGMVGGAADKLASQRAQALAEQRAQALYQERWDREQADRSRRQALDAARRGDYQALGKAHAQEVLEQDQARHIDGFKRRATTDAYGAVQSAVNEIANGFAPEVVALAAERMGDLPGDADFSEGFKRWLPALINAQAEYLAGRPEAKKRVEQELTPALRSRLIAEMNGTEPVADGGTGQPQRVRQITDEQIAAMDPEEWVKVYDVKAGRFRPGYAHKPTRSLDPRSMQVVGRGA